MAQELILAEVRALANSTFKSGMFGIKNGEQAFVLMNIAQAEGLHPIQAMQMYDVIQGRPALKSTEILARFMDAGGKIEWIETTPKVAKAKFTHPQSGTFEHEYTIEDAGLAKLTGKDNWKTRPKEMLRSRCVSSGVRMSYPRCLNNMYSSEEVAEFEPQETPQEEEIIESEIEETPNIDDLKKSLALVLKKDYSMTGAMIKEFAEVNELAENGTLIEELIKNEILLNEYITKFDEGNQDGN